MTMRLEPYDPQKHDRDKIARLIFESDVEMNALVYGAKPLEVIRGLLDAPQSYFTPELMRCAMLDGELAGVVVVYPASRRQEIDKQAGQGFMKAMGLVGFIRSLSLYTKMDKMLGGEIDDDSLYIHTLCVDGALRGRGVGSEIIRALAEENPRMCLYVNADNDAAIRFYERNGFRQAFHGTMRHKGKQYGEYLMRRD